MGQGRNRPEHGTIANEYIKLAPTGQNGRAEPVQPVKVFEVTGYQRCLTTQCPNFVIKLFKRALGARQSDDMDAGRGKSQCHGPANTT